VNAVRFPFYGIDGVHASHIYSYNWKFADMHKEQMAKVLNDTHFKILAWSLNENNTCALGVKNVVFIGKVNLVMTGSSESHKIYIYAKVVDVSID
jgi:hypothetical protein